MAQLFNLYTSCPSICGQDEALWKLFPQYHLLNYISATQVFRLNAGIWRDTLAKQDTHRLWKTLWITADMGHLKAAKS